jgi:radical SAM protein with 4Fe4S-binding SPASM domain
MSSDQTLNENISAIIQPRIHSSEKSVLENAIPLQTPFSAHIDVCSLCNFKCSFCFQADTIGKKKKGFPHGFMKLDLFKKTVNDLKDFPDRLKKIKIGNHGEPTLHPLLPKMIEYARSQNVADVIEVFTNGSKLNPELNKALVDAGLQRINISLEGLTSERYLKVAGAKIDMDQLVENIKNLYDYSRTTGDLTIYIKIVNHPSALKKEDSKIYSMTKVEKDFFYKTYGNICDEIYIEKIVPQWAETQEGKQNDVYVTGMYYQKTVRYKKVCPFIFMYLHINHDGITSPCTLDWPREVEIGNASKQSALEIWNGKKLKDLQIAQLEGKRNEIPFCKDCSAPMVCCEENLDKYVRFLLEKIQR